jgi:Fe-S-cluster containining protein
VQKDFRDIHYLKEKDKKCMFLKKGKKTACRIYNARPKICRQYPSELINRSCKPEELASDKLFQK